MNSEFRHVQYRLHSTYSTYDEIFLIIMNYPRTATASLQTKPDTKSLLLHGRAYRQWFPNQREEYLLGRCFLRGVLGLAFKLLVIWLCLIFSQQQVSLDLCVNDKLYFGRASIYLYLTVWKCTSLTYLINRLL